MSKLLKQLNDNQNKVADTNGIMKLQAWDDGVAQDLTGKKITATVANASGFLFDLDLVSNGTEIDLDFKDSQLQKLTPDTYFLEIKVTDEAGDVSVFPTEGYAIFTINKNLHATEGALVPQITFDTVLADVKTAMDKKVADYVKTIAKGDKGDTGVVDTTTDYTFTGTNTFDKKIIAPAGVQGNADTATTAEKVSDTTVVHTDSAGSVLARSIDLLHKYPYVDFHFGNSTADYTSRIIEDSEGVLSVYNAGFIKGTIRANVQGNLNGNADTATKLQTTPKINGVNFNGTFDINVNAANDSNIVHKSGNETVAGDKTFTGKVAVSGTIDSAEKVYTRTIGSTNDLQIIYTRVGNVVTGRYTAAKAGVFTLSNNDGYKAPTAYPVNVIGYNINAWFTPDNKFESDGASVGNFMFITSDPLPKN